MNKKKAIQAFNLKSNPVNTDGAAAFDFKWRIDHPYSHDKSKWKGLKFKVFLTRFEDGVFGYKMYGYETPLMTEDEARRTYAFFTPDWQRKGRRTWNSVHLVGVDEQGNAFEALDW